VNIFSSMMAAMGRQLKQSVNVFHNFMLYRRLPDTHVSSVGKEKTPARTFIVKAVNPVDACALVVSAQDEKILGVLDLVRQQKANRLERLLPAVNVVAEEEIVRLGREAPVLEQPQQVVVLPMDTPCAGVSAIISSERAHDAPHILIGASSSSKMGWLMNISRALVWFLYLFFVLSFIISTFSASNHSQLDFPPRIFAANSFLAEAWGAPKPNKYATCPKWKQDLYWRAHKQTCQIQSKNHESFRVMGTKQRNTLSDIKKWYSVSNCSFQPLGLQFFI
jgi:hypothetical protein